MKIAVGSDMKTHLTDVVVEELRKRGHEVNVYGALDKGLALWSQVAVEVAEQVSVGKYNQAVLFCWY
jgi:ribose 5-phosphate isomerase B